MASANRTRGRVCSANKNGSGSEQAAPLEAGDLFGGEAGSFTRFASTSWAIRQGLETLCRYGARVSRFARFFLLNFFWVNAVKDLTEQYTPGTLSCRAVPPQTPPPRMNHRLG